MTIKEFMNLFDLKNESTVIKWIKDGYIQGAYRDEKANEYFIPNLARPPYTKARAKTTDAIYKSMVKACIKRKGVCAKLYKLDDIEFQAYIQDLAEAGYIRIEVQNNIEYYFATIKAKSLLNVLNLKIYLKAILVSLQSVQLKVSPALILKKQWLDKNKKSYQTSKI